MERCGIVLAGGTGSRLYPVTIALSKQLLPIHDKPMIYYPLSVLMLANIREILLISTPHDIGLFERLLGDGSQFGLFISYAVQPYPRGLAEAYKIGEKFVQGRPSCLILGDNLLYGHSLSATLNKATQKKQGATIFGYHVSNPSAYGVVEFDRSMRVISIEEKPLKPKSSYAIPGIYFYDGRAPSFAHQLKPSARGELEITDLNKKYWEEGSLDVELLGRGIAWLDTGTHDLLYDASLFVKTIEQRQGLKIGCLEEIAYHKGWIGEEQLQSQIKKMGNSSYANYLRHLLETPRTFV
ncbi:glucose-1-phosphate thymidylyltransferase RfbA [Methylacidiphilum caldifontis]|uniref:Glucose-1-phosphate thymidylyltransferase n=1 Tax=Methylacidiphilum caldifontis TaxID=2795386 RepID=A0A4Y8PD20_9BACT|nr:glucose-1-phosphate thymidylyltransferase RfbA [Methylacidiphilum caldifontis]QSR87968.1 glucose-1-phosphate thymidylyltransferase RfbA [Methylacidiphilum caldifontis]TFE68728.1 glucose-1-phosphate thymidylyltransferase [Methylacidiphilum caldifontis]